MHQALAPARKKTRQASPKQKPAPSRVAGERLVLEQVAPESLEALNAFYRRRPPSNLVVAGEAMTLAPLWPLPGEIEYPQSTIAFIMGDAKGELHAPRSLVERWLVQADPDVDLARLAPEHAALLLEFFLGSELAWLEERLGYRIAVTAIENLDAASGAAPLAFRLTGKQDENVCTLRLEDTGHAARLFSLLGNGEKRAIGFPLDLPVPVSLWRGAVTVGARDLQSLQPGDVVLLDEIENQAASALIVIGGRLVAPVEFIGPDARLIARPVPVAGSKWEWIMNNANDSVQTLEDSDLDGLPVTLVFELGRTALPLGEVKRLAPGAIVPLPEVAKETVDVIANGKRVGRGEIVRIGESLGVRVIRMFDNA